jgi:hypothetical protein
MTLHSLLKTAWNSGVHFSCNSFEIKGKIDD